VALHSSTEFAGARDSQVAPPQLAFRHLRIELSEGIKRLTPRRNAREVSQSLAEWASLAARSRLSRFSSANKLPNASATFAAGRGWRQAASRFPLHHHSRALSSAARSRRNWPAMLDPTGFASLRALSDFALISDFSRSHEHHKWRNPSPERFTEIPFLSSRFHLTYMTS